MEYLCGTTEVITRYFCGTLTVLLHLRSSQRGDDALAPMYATKFNVCHRVRKNSYTAKPVMSAGRSTCAVVPLQVPLLSFIFFCPLLYVLVD